MNLQPFDFATGRSHGMQSRTGPAASASAAVEALQGLTALLTATLGDATLPGVGPEVAGQLEGTDRRSWQYFYNCTAMLQLSQCILVMQH